MRPGNCNAAGFISAKPVGQPGRETAWRRRPANKTSQIPQKG
jgi:hypothetical protein